jgi:glycosyltransferase involved in cell wall biosynthesis
MTSPKTIIIVPCYNEATRLDINAFIAFARTTPHILFLFVNDGSTDTTRALIDGMQKERPASFLAMHLAANQGKAEAVRQGFIKAFSLEAPFVGFLDADLAAPLACVPQLEAVFADPSKEIAMGARVALLGRHVERNGLRHILGRVFATIASMILGLRVYDTQCGAKLFRVTDRLKQAFASRFSVKWIFDVEILARFVISGNTINRPVDKICVEVPLLEWIDKKGSKLKPGDFLVSIFDLLKISLALKRRSF